MDIDIIDIEPKPKLESPMAGKIFFAVFFLLVAGSVAFTYWKVIVARDFTIVAQADCDPYAENCFVHVCNPDPEMDGECTGDPIEDTWYTKNMIRQAYNIPDCDPTTDENCTALVCGEGEEGCSYELCDLSNVPEGDTCNDPLEYTQNNPIEEETEEVDGDIEVDGADEDSLIDENEFPSDLIDENDVMLESDDADDTSVEVATDCDSPDDQSCNVPIDPGAAQQ